MNSTTNLHRNAMALNNIGVSLLRRGQFKDAIDTLRQAVSYLGVQCDNGSRLQMSNLTLAQAVNLLTTKPAECESTKLHILSGNESENGPLGTNLIISILEESLAGTRSSLVAFTIEAECIDNFDYSAVLLLYNFGVAHLFMHEQTREHQLLYGALTLFRYSHNILLKQVEQCEVTTSYFQFSLLLIGSLNVHHIMLIHRQLHLLQAECTTVKQQQQPQGHNHFLDEQRARHNLIELIAMIWDEEQYMKDFYGNSNSAAAAA